MIQVVIADDHPLMREGMRSLLERQADIAVIGEASNGEEVVRLAREMRPDIILMDLEMPGVDGLEATRLIRAEGLDTKVLVLTIHKEKEYVRGLMRAGADGYILKTTLGPAVVESIKLATMGEIVLDSGVAREVLDTGKESLNAGNDLAAGPCGLNDRQMRILRWVANGMATRQMAEQLGVTERTMKGYVAKVLDKLGVSSRAAAVAVAMRRGILKAEDTEIQS